MTIDFYYIPGSAPCRAVRMAAKAVGVELNLKLTNLVTGEHLKPEFIAVSFPLISFYVPSIESHQLITHLLHLLQLNPQHTVPTLVDDGFVLWESRAIIAYLVEKYGKTDSLYPTDPQKRALVNQRMYFDQGTLYQRLADFYYPQIFAKQPPNADNLKKLEDALGFLNTFLENSTYAAGETLTLADITLVATVSTLEVASFDLTKYPNVARWLAKCKATTPGYDLNEAGLLEFKNKFFNN